MTFYSRWFRALPVPHPFADRGVADVSETAPSFSPFEATPEKKFIRYGIRVVSCGSTQEATATGTVTVHINEPALATTKSEEPADVGRVDCRPNNVGDASEPEEL
jgi:hypothetical protein